MYTMHFYQVFNKKGKKIFTGCCGANIFHGDFGWFHYTF